MNAITIPNKCYIMKAITIMSQIYNDRDIHSGLLSATKLYFLLLTSLGYFY